MKKNDLFAVYNLLKARFLKKKVPLVVGWSLTDRCNLACSYCLRRKRRVKELSTSQIFSIIDELSSMHTYSINFTGGEALLREDISEVIDYAKIKNIKTGLSTNGLLVSQKINEIRKVDYLTLSFDGCEDVHSLQRGGGDYRQVLAAIKAAKENNIHIRLHTVLTKNNVESISFFLEFVKEYDVVIDFSVIEFDPFSDKKNVLLLLPSEEKFKSAIHRLIVEKAKGNRNIGNSFEGLRYLYHWPKHRKITCCAGRIYFRIETNGDIYPCSNLVYKVDPLNCIKSGFKETFLNLESIQCKSCWCSTRIDMNYAFALNLRTIFDLKMNYHL